MSFFNQVKELSLVIDELGNPFIDESNDLLVLDTRDLADPSVVNTMRSIKNIGQEQYNTFVTARLVTRVLSIKQSN